MKHESIYPNAPGHRALFSVPLGAAKEQKFPQRTGAPSTDVHWIGEAQPIPVRSYALNDDCEIKPRKFGFIAALSREAAKRASGEHVVRRLIREDAAASLDAAYFSADAGTDVVHAGLRHGVSGAVQRSYSAQGAWHGPTAIARCARRKGNTA